MPRPATGTTEAYEHADGRTITYRLRVSAYGQRHRLTLGTNHTGWSLERAELERERIAGQIERGTWEPPETHTPAPARVEGETVHAFLNDWYARKRPDITGKTRSDYEWRLDHLLYHIGRREVEALDVRAIDQLKVDLATGDDRRAPLSPRSVNMVLGVLAQALDDAVDYGLLAANPARGRKRRMKEPPSPRTFLEPDMVVDVLDAAGEWERELQERQRYGRRAFLALLILGGPRIDEAIRARRGRLDLQRGSVILGSKTEAGTDRRVELTAYLLGELRAHLAAVPARLRAEHLPEHPIFPTVTGRHLNASNVRTRLLDVVVDRVNAKRAAEGAPLLPARVTPHTLRRTFASMCFFAGRDMRFVMAQLGHADPRMTLRVYAQTMERRRIDTDLVWELMHFPDEAESSKVLPMVPETARRPV